MEPISCPESILFLDKACSHCSAQHLFLLVQCYTAQNIFLVESTAELAHYIKVLEL